MLVCYLRIYLTNYEAGEINSNQLTISYFKCFFTISFDLRLRELVYE